MNRINGNGKTIDNNIHTEINIKILTTIDITTIFNDYGNNNINNGNNGNGSLKYFPITATVYDLDKITTSAR